MNQEISPTKNQSAGINRYAYFLYLLLVIYQLCTGNFEWAVSSFGIALIFDPFDGSVKWQNRPKYQKIWLLAHLTILLAGFAILVFR